MELQEFTRELYGLSTGLIINALSIGGTEIPFDLNVRTSACLTKILDAEGIAWTEIPRNVVSSYNNVGIPALVCVYILEGEIDQKALKSLCRKFRRGTSGTDGYKYDIKIGYCNLDKKEHKLLVDFPFSDIDLRATQEGDIYLWEPYKPKF